MRFATRLLPGTLIARYQRFFADVRLDSGETVTAHCPNTGSMLGCQTPGLRVWLSRADNPARRLAYTLELVEAAPGVLVGVHTGRSNRLVEEAIRAGCPAGLAGYTQFRREVRCQGSRIDLLLSGPGLPDCYVEVKNVTAKRGAGVALFPDAVTRRGEKHLRDLARLVALGNRGVIFFCVQRADVQEVRPADDIDPAYGRALREVLAAGVEAFACRAQVSTEGIVLTTPVPVRCP
ncbi:DNA/RNA nuclease SfsA [Thiobacter aerophilum]|uniref:Sugar fermentation stimulation protein homolog n=1 Tax=Thiobacter aerophilum TaxID=3121275 RepID=A0ABV0EFS2_9BURK